MLAPVAAGRELVLFGDAAWRFGTLICSEITDATAARRFAALGARLLVSVNNDVWFGDPEAPHVVWRASAPSSRDCRSCAPAIAARAR